MALNKTQRTSLAKFFYDAAKLTFGGTIVAPFVTSQLGNVKVMLAGLFVTAVFVSVGLYLEKGA